MSLRKQVERLLKMLPGVYVLANILQVPYSYESGMCSFFALTVSGCIILANGNTQKGARKID